MTSHDESEALGGRDLLQPGNLVGRYRLLGQLATGGMAQIWAARNDSNRFARTLVVKVIRPDYATDDEYRRMLIDEATAAAAVRHPNVCEILELGSHKDMLFIAMEWIAGSTLAGLIRKDGERDPLPYEHAAKIVAKACAGLHAAHEALGADGKPLGIVHRDISPQNLLLSVSGQVKLTDFGIAKARDQLHARTRTGNIKGKFAYIPPEQVKGGLVDRRADIYAMGCVLYIATTGLRPFGAGPRAALSKILRGDFRSPSQVMPNYPADLEAITLKALRLLPEDRFQTAEDFRQALEAWLAKRGAFISESTIGSEVKKRLSDAARQQIRSLKNAKQFARAISSYGATQTSESADTRTASTELMNLLEGPGNTIEPATDGEETKLSWIPDGNYAPPTLRDPHPEPMEPAPCSEPTVIAPHQLTDARPSYRPDEHGDGSESVRSPDPSPRETQPAEAPLAEKSQQEDSPQMSQTPSGMLGWVQGLFHKR